MGKKLKQALGKLKIYFIPKKIEKFPAKKISQRVKLSIPHTTHRKPISLPAVGPGYTAIIVGQVAAPSVTGIVL